jgi:xylan 1,4-beta-xylosidase
MREWAENVRRLAKGRPVYYTEWNTSSNPRDPLHDQPYAAAFVTKTVMEAAGIVEGYSFWAFTDIFAENYFPSIPFQGGFGLLNLQGIAKPTYRAFELLHRLGTERLPVDGRHATVDAWAVRDAHRLTIFLTNHVLPRQPIAVEKVHVQLKNANAPHSAVIERIDEDHANARKLWRQMGEPTYPTAGDLERLDSASRLHKAPQSCKSAARTISLDVELPPHAVAAVTLEFASAG